MTEETTTEQLAEIEGQGESTPGTEYTPPEGWRVLAVGEVLRDGDMWVWPADDPLRQTLRAGAVVGANQRYIRPIEPQPEPEPVQVREGRWRTRSGGVKNIRPCEPLKGAYYVWPWTDGFMTFQDNGLHQGSKESPNDLVEYLGPIEPQPEPQPEPVPEPQAADTAATEYTPPDGYRVLQIGEVVQKDDIFLAVNGEHWPAKRIGETVNNNRYIRRIEVSQPCAPCDSRDNQADYTPPEGWRVLRSGELLQPGDHWVNWEGTVSRPDIQHGDGATVSGGRYIRWVKPQPQPSPQPESDTELQAQVAFLKGREVTLATRLQQEKQVTTRLREELATQAETSRRLQIELDAAQQVPADSPELRQLRADLAEVTQDRDTYRHAHELLLNDVNATHQRTKAMTVEAIAEWLEPIRLADSAYLANATMQHLPKIMRHLTGLDSHAID